MTLMIDFALFFRLVLERISRSPFEFCFWPFCRQRQNSGGFSGNILLGIVLKAFFFFFFFFLIDPSLS